MPQRLDNSFCCFGLIRGCACPGAAPAAGGCGRQRGADRALMFKVQVTPDAHQHLPPAKGAHPRWLNDQDLTLRSTNPRTSTQNSVLGSGACSTLRGSTNESLLLCGLMPFKPFPCLSQLLLCHEIIIFLLVLNETVTAVDLKMGCCVFLSLGGGKLDWQVP